MMTQMTSRKIKMSACNAEASVVVSASILIVFAMGCGNMLDRPTPSKEDFTDTYFDYFDKTRIEKVDYAYKGAVGGIMASAKVQFKGPVKTREIVFDEAVKNGKIVLEEYDPSTLSDIEMCTFKRKWTLASDGKMPSWLDIPFNKKMRKIMESCERKGANPEYRYEWYIDDDRNAVYLNVFIN